MNVHDYQLTFEERNSYLYIRLTGEDSFAASLSYWNEIADQVRLRGSSRVLIHENLIGDVAEGEMAKVIMDLVPSGLADVQIAFFDENRDDDAINQLGQSLALDKGAYVKIFQSLESAKEWIAGDE
jgi:hypothetical protein